MSHNRHLPGARHRLWIDGLCPQVEKRRLKLPAISLIDGGVREERRLPTSKLSTLVGSIKHGSIAAVGEQFRRLNLETSRVGKAVGKALKISPTKGSLLAKGILTTAKSLALLKAERRQLISWARDAGSDERQLVTCPFLHINWPFAPVDAMSEMGRPQARPFMVDYFKAGGDMKIIVQWLSLVGGVLCRHGRNDVLKNLLDAAVATGQTLEDVLDAGLVQPA